MLAEFLGALSFLLIFVRLPSSRLTLWTSQEKLDHSQDGLKEHVTSGRLFKEKRFGQNDIWPCHRGINKCPTLLSVNVSSWNQTWLGPTFATFMNCLPARLPNQTLMTKTKTSDLALLFYAALEIMLDMVWFISIPSFSLKDYFISLETHMVHHYKMSKSF